MSILGFSERKLGNVTGEMRSGSTRAEGESEKIVFEGRVLTGEQLERHAAAIENFLRNTEIKGVKWNPMFLLRRMDDTRNQGDLDNVIDGIVSALGPEYNYMYPEQNPNPRGQFSLHTLYKNFEIMMKLIVARRKART